MNNTAKTILLVEDDAIIALAEKKTIEKHGYNVVHALTGEEAVRLMSTPDCGIDLILMDIDLGRGLDGTEAAQIILKESNIPVIFLSSHAEPEVIDKVEKITSYGYILKGSNPAVLFASVRMAFRLFDANNNLKNSYVTILNEITERKKAEEKLKYSYELLKYFIKHAQAAIAIHDRDLKYLYVSDRYIKDYNIKDYNIIGKHHYEVFPDLPEKWRKVHQLALLGMVSNGDDDPFLREDGSIDWTKWECRPWHDIEGNIGGIIVYTEVITEKVNALLELKKFAAIFENARWGVAVSAGNGNSFDIANPEFARMHGYTPEEMMNVSIHDVFAPQVDVSEIISEVNEKGHISIETLHKRKDGTVFPVQLDASAVKDNNGNVKFRIVNLIDISEKKRTEENILSSEERYVENMRLMLREKESLLKEKEILLKETHHRVKNNLQIVSSLLSLQSELINERNYADAFSDSCNRVRSMAIVHEMLYKRNNFSRIDFKDYSDQLISFLRSSLGRGDMIIETEFGANDITLVIDSAINIGLILNELISNAIKYSGSGEGGSFVKFSAFAEGDFLFISVRDNGAGIPQEKFNSDSDTLGLTLVKSLTGQLKGEIELITGCGTEFRLKIPLNPLF